jgi:CRISPR-associated protein Cas1
MNSQLDTLTWRRLTFTLVNTRLLPSIRSHAFSVVQAIVKHVSAHAGVQPDKQHVFFHIRDRHHTLKLRTGIRLDVDIMFPGAAEEIAPRWNETLQAYLATEEGGKNFSLAQLPTLEDRSFAKLSAELAVEKSEGEICLDFLSPVPFRAAKGRRRTNIEHEAFVNLFLGRFSRLFDRKFEYASSRDRFSVLPYYWHYTEIKHDSVSQEGHTQYINGCTGKLYLKGLFKDFLPYLILGSELHAGGKLGNSQGYFVLRPDSPPYFSSFFPRPEPLVHVISDVLQRYDHAAESLAAEEGLQFDPVALAAQIAQQLATDSYVASPNKAFLIRKKNGTDRLVEQLSFRDLIVQEYLLRTFSDVAERIFEEESIGYRKGVSRQRAAEMIQHAVSEGYRFVIESDVEDFFPSVELRELRRLLELYIPEKDRLLVHCLMRCACASYVLDGSLHERTKGLAQGSPLSPILANLYLDAFDEAIASRDVRLVRYADDFVILTKTEEQAQSLLVASESLLAAIGLHLNKDKTAIRPVSEGFEFLGIRFDGREATLKPEEELHLLKKPVYVTEPFLFLGVNGDALELKRGGTVMETIPFRRISEIMVMERSAFSTSVIRKCTEADIPLTITLDSGYYITTVKPDSKRYYDIAFEHARKYYALDDTARLAIAKEFAANKIGNYVSLFKQRYEPSMNLFLKELDELVARIHGAATVDIVRGFEAAAAKKVYQRLNTLIDNPAFHIITRERKAPDRINSMLNFSYYLLFARINATLRAVGLNPYLGFLHSPDNRYESLASDIVELFRARVDRIVLRMLNLKVITPEDFVQPSSLADKSSPRAGKRETGYYLTHDAHKKFLNHYEGEMERKASGGTLSLKETIYVQVQIMKKWVMEDHSLTFYQWKV